MATQIFLSHITAEHELAGLLKQRIERHFLEQVDVFVSSDQESIQAGEPWLDALQRNLTTASMAIVLCSPASVGRPWLNFEAGAAWLRQIPVVPLCHSGLVPDQLPMPLSALQGGQVSDPDTLARLYRRIATLVPCGCPDPGWTSYAGELSRVTTASQAPDADAAAAQASPAPRPAGLDELRRMAEAGDEKAIASIAVRQSPEAWSILCEVAADSIDDQLRVAAIKALAGLRPPGDITPLCHLVVQDRWQVAAACARALGRFKDPAAIPYLIRASDQHVDWLTTQQCATALGVFAPQQPEVVCPALVRALEFSSFEGEAASQSLQRYQKLALPYLFSALEKGALLKGLSQALKTVVMIGDKQALPRLEALYREWTENLTGPARDQVLADMGKSVAQLKDAPAPT